MKNILIINTHHAYPFSEGKLNKTLVNLAETYFKSAGFEVKHTQMSDSYDIDEEIEKHQWADGILVQSPVNWMDVPWIYKKYMDEVYTNGMDGRLCDGDGRTRKDPSKQYGTGGTLNGKKYMISLTFNAPRESFNDPDQFLFQGKSIDDLFFPMHMNFRFFGLEALESFACFDVMKNPDIENDLAKFSKLLEKNFPKNS